MNEENILLYETPEGKVSIQIRYEGETFWLNQKAMAELFGVEIPAVNKHLANIYETGELTEAATVSILETVQQEGSRIVKRKVAFYNLDAVIAVGYRVNSKQATQFRIWATQTLKEYIMKGFVLDDERMKSGKAFGKDYFDELLARIRDIRASEKRFYQKIRDLFSLSSDYDKTDRQTELFFAEVQNKLLFAVTGKTAAELIIQRADANQPNMGLTSWKGSRVRKEDIFIAKNYLTADEIDTLNRIVTLFLDTAELRVKERIPLSISFWKSEADRVIQFSNKALLTGTGSRSKQQMEQAASGQYARYDAARKSQEALEADRADTEALEKLMAAAKNKKP